MARRPMRLRLVAQAGGEQTKMSLSGHLSNHMTSEERKQLLAALAAASRAGLDVVLCVDRRGSPDWCDGWTDALSAVPARLTVQFEVSKPLARRGL
jgi:hypothetical protein